MKAIRAIIAVYDGIDMLDYAGALSPISKARGVEFTHLGGTFVTSCGVSINPNHCTREVLKTDVLIIPGGSGVDSVPEDGLLRQCCKRHFEKGATTVTICSGLRLLRHSSILRHCVAATHENKRDGYPTGLRFCNGVVKNGNLLSVGGPMHAAIPKGVLGGFIALSQIDRAAITEVSTRMELPVTIASLSAWTMVADLGCSKERTSR